jgi:glucoamylase
MRLLSLAALAACSIPSVFADPYRAPPNLAKQIEQENKVAFQGVLDNIGPHGRKAPGASAGVIIASPSTQDPDCT